MSPYRAEPQAVYERLASFAALVFKIATFPKMLSGSPSQFFFPPHFLTLRFTFLSFFVLCSATQLCCICAINFSLSGDLPSKEGNNVDCLQFPHKYLKVSIPSAYMIVREWKD